MKVLIVEDDFTCRKVLHKFLSFITAFLKSTYDPCSVRAPAMLPGAIVSNLTIATIKDDRISY